MAKADKVSTVAEITEKFRSSNAAVITEYRGLTMAQLTELRRSLGSDTAYTVAKNTLVQRAAADAGVEGLEQMLVPNGDRVHHRRAGGRDQDDP